MHCLYGGYNLHRFSDALGLVHFSTASDIIGIKQHTHFKTIQNIQKKCPILDYFEYERFKNYFMVS